MYLIFIGRSIYYVGLKRTYKLQTVPQVGKIIHVAKCLEFAAFKAGEVLRLKCFSEIRRTESIQKQVIVTFRYIMDM